MEDFYCPSGLSPMGQHDSEDEDDRTSPTNSESDNESMQSDTSKDLDHDFKGSDTESDGFEETDWPNALHVDPEGLSLPETSTTNCDSDNESMQSDTSKDLDPNFNGSDTESDLSRSSSVSSGISDGFEETDWSEDLQVDFEESHRPRFTQEPDQFYMEDEDGSSGLDPSGPHDSEDEDQRTSTTSDYESDNESMQSDTSKGLDQKFKGSDTERFTQEPDQCYMEKKDDPSGLDLSGPHDNEDEDHRTTSSDCDSDNESMQSDRSKDLDHKFKGSDTESVRALPHSASDSSGFSDGFEETDRSNDLQDDFEESHLPKHKPTWNGFSTSTKILGVLLVSSLVLLKLYYSRK